MCYKKGDETLLDVVRSTIKKRFVCLEKRKASSFGRDFQEEINFI